jgi:hypothetical protein
MFIGKYTPNNYFLQSYATIQSNCMQIGNGRYEWNGIDGSATGSSCSAARQAYCNRYGKDGKCYGDIGGPAHDDPKIPSQQNRAAGRAPSNTGGGGSGIGLGKTCGPPKSGDPISYWNNLACQWESATGLPDYSLTVVVGLGGLLMLGLLTKRR